MTRLIHLLARCLEPVERDVVLGDIAESGEGVTAALRDLLGLMLRRQAGLWRDWHPWLALVGVVGLAGVPLSRIAFALSVDLREQLVTHGKYGVWYGTGMPCGQVLVSLFCTALALAAWSWISGFALGSLSGHAAWLIWYAFYLVVMDAAWARFVMAGNIILRDPQTWRLLLRFVLPLPLGIVPLLFVLSSLYGAWLGVRRRSLSIQATCVALVAITIVTSVMLWTGGWRQAAHVTWSGGAWHGITWPQRLEPFLLADCPMVWLLAAACGRRRTA
jgi:hypothetical protein